MKKSIVKKFLDYKLNDSKPVVKKVEDIHIIISDILSIGMSINEPL